MSIEVEVAQTLGEVNEILKEIAKEKIDPSVYTQILSDFSEEKKMDLQRIVDSIENPLGEKTITISTIFGDGVDLTIWQEVWMKNGEITKYGRFYAQGLQPSGIQGIAGGGATPIAIPLPDEVEFDALFFNWNVFHARPKLGQRDLAGISGSLDCYIFSFGNGSQGALGHGRTDNIFPSYAHRHCFSSRVKSILFPCEFGVKVSSVALLENKELFGTGSNDSGTLGIGNNAQVNAWTKITTEVDNYAIGYPALFVVKNNELYACGSNEMGILGVGDAANKNTLTFVKSLSRFGGIKNDRFYDGRTVYAGTLLYDGREIWGAGKNGDHNFTSTSTSNQNRFIQITDALGSVMEVGEGASFAISENTNVILIPKDGDTEMYVAGYGSCGYGNDEEPGTNKKRHKVKTLSGRGWEVVMPRLAYGAGTDPYAFFVLNKEKKEIHVFGKNINGNLGVGQTAEVTIKTMEKLSLPVSLKQFEVGFGRYKAAGSYLLAVIDGVLYSTGTSASGRLKVNTPVLSPMARVN